MTTTSASEVALAPDVPVPPRRSLLRDARDDLRAIVRYRHLLAYLVSSSLRTENANTVFGFLWWVLDPLLMSCVYVVFVGVILGRGSPDYPIFILTAIIPWALFYGGVRDAITNTVSKEKTMRQVAFPKSILPISRVLGEGVHFCFGYLVLLLAATLFGFIPSVYALIAIPVGLIQLIFTMGVAFFLTAVNVFFRDTNKLTQYVFRMWFYLSPALYSVQNVPKSIRPYYELNPFAAFFPAYRDAIMYHQVPDLANLGVVAGVSLVVLALGYLFFVRLAPWFAKLV